MYRLFAIATLLTAPLIIMAVQAFMPRPPAAEEAVNGTAPMPAVPPPAPASVQPPPPPMAEPVPAAPDYSVADSIDSGAGQPMPGAGQPMLNPVGQSPQGMGAGAIPPEFPQ